MKIKDFHITGQYPTLFVETEVETPNSDDSNQTVRLNLGPWSYVSVLSETDLKSLVHLVYQSQQHNQTRAMTNLTGASLENASNSDLP